MSGYLVCYDCTYKLGYIFNIYNKFSFNFKDFIIIKVFIMITIRVWNIFKLTKIFFFVKYKYVYNIDVFKNLISLGWSIDCTVSFTVNKR